MGPKPSSRDRRMIIILGGKLISPSSSYCNQSEMITLSPILETRSRSAAAAFLDPTFSEEMSFDVPRLY